VSKAVAYYDNIYLVGSNEERTGEHRVTEREGKERPGVLAFSGNYPMSTGDETYGTLVLNETLYTKWFGSRKRIPGMEDAATAAATLVREHSNIHYGCPVCTYRGKIREDAEAHVQEHINKNLSQYRIEIVED
jgi:hypothetical protein